MSQPDAMMTSDSISPSTIPMAAIPAINAQDGTVNIAGRDLTFITNNYNVDHNCDQSITRYRQPAAQTHHLFRQNIRVVVCCHPICKLSWSSQSSPRRHWFVVHRRSAFRKVEGNGWRFCLDLRLTYEFSSPTNHHRF